MPQELTIQTIQPAKSVTLKLADTSLVIENKSVIYRQVIWAVFDPDSRVLDIAYLKDNKKGILSLARIEGKVLDSSNDIASGWTNTLMHTIYEGSGLKRCRRLKILVNPYGGTKKGVAVFIRKVEPIFRAARCSLDVMYTTHHGHAYEIARTLQLEYDAIITVSGDGLIHEVMNGFANHEHPRKAFAIPIAPIPTGSGNGLALNLLGIERGFDVMEAALNVIKGKPMKVDAFSLTQNGKRTISFMSQALGLMADLDIGTEHLRWMGDTRFMVGLIKGVIQFKPCPVQISIKVAEQDKLKMAEALHARNHNDQTGISKDSADLQYGDGLPPLAYSPDDADDWTTLPEPLLYIYAGKGPYVGRDFMAFPVSLPDDGLIDVMALPVSSRKDILSSIGNAANGESYWNPKLYYVKAHAYKVKPLVSKGSLAIDGEVFPFDEFQVEVHQGLATLLSPYGHYAAKFSPRTQSNTTEQSRKN